MEQPAEVDVLSLMEERLPRYVMNCLCAAGCDDLEVIASLDVTEGENSSCISGIENYIERRHKNNTEMLPPCHSSESDSSLPFEFPPVHRIRIFKFVEEVKQLCKSKQSSSVSKRAKASKISKKAELKDQASIQIPLSVDEVTCQVHESLNDWIHKQKAMSLNSLKEGKHYSVIAKNLGNGKFSVLINCNMCRTSIRSHPQKAHFGIQNWTRHVKICAAHHNIVDPTQPQLFAKQLASGSLALGQKCQPKKPVATNDSNQQVFH